MIAENWIKNFLQAALDEHAKILSMLREGKATAHLEFFLKKLNWD